METQKDEFLRDLPEEMLAKLKELADRLWAERNVVAVPLVALMEELEADVKASRSALSDYERYYKERLAAEKREHDALKDRLQAEISGLRTLISSLEVAARENAVRMNELRGKLEQSESRSREKYTRDEVGLLENQVLSLKKEIGEFHKVKERDDRRILELEGQVAIKAEEVERRYVARMAQLEKENSELEKRNAELEGSVREDDARIKELRTALEKSERSGREKYSKEEVSMIERQVEELKKELGEFRLQKEKDSRRMIELEGEVATKAGEVERRYIAANSRLEKENGELRERLSGLESSRREEEARAAEVKGALEQRAGTLKEEISALRKLREEDAGRLAGLEAALAEKTGPIESRYAGRISMLEKKNSELASYAAELEKAKSDSEEKAAGLKKALAVKERELSERYQEKDVRQLEEIIVSLREELSSLKGQKLEAERKVADMERSLGEKQEEIDKKYLSRIASLDSQAAELKGAVSSLEADNGALAAKLSDIKKAVIARDRELLELKTRLSDSEMEYNEKLAEKKKELDGERLRLQQKQEEENRKLQAEYAQKQRTLEARKADLEADFNAKKLELIRTFDKVREEMELREKVLAAREGKLGPGQGGETKI